MRTYEEIFVRQHGHIISSIGILQDALRESAGEFEADVNAGEARGNQEYLNAHYEAIEALDSIVGMLENVTLPHR